MTDEQTKIEDDKKPTEDTGGGDKPTTSRLVDDTNLAAKRMEEATAAAGVEREKTEKNYADMKLGGTAGGHVEAKEVSPEKAKANQAQEYFKGSALGDAIKKANEEENMETEGRRFKKVIKSC